MRKFQQAVNQLAETMHAQQQTYGFRYQDGRRIKGPSMHDAGIAADHPKR